MPIIIFFDDALVNTYEVAWPVMDEYGYRGTIGVITDYVGRVWPDPPYRDKPVMTLAQLLDMRDDGWDMQSHSHTHPQFSAISRLEAEYEFLESKTWISDNLGVRPKCFLWPFGIIAHEDLVREYYPFDRSVDREYWDGVSRRLGCFSIPAFNAGDIASVARDPHVYGCLLFHSIVPNPEDGWECTPAQFEAALNAIYSRDVDVVTFTEAVSGRFPLLPVAGMFTVGFTYAVSKAFEKRRN